LWAIASEDDADDEDTEEEGPEYDSSEEEGDGHVEEVATRLNRFGRLVTNAPMLESSIPPELDWGPRDPLPTGASRPSRRTLSPE
jgi:hypothetical protein